jgi:hypothetical protein
MNITDSSFRISGIHIYARHIIIMGHTYGNRQDTVEVIQVTRKGRHMNSTFVVYKNKTFR